MSTRSGDFDPELVSYLPRTEQMTAALNRKHNAVSAPIISRSTERVDLRGIRTDEELMIARSVCRTLGLGMESN